MSSDRHAAMEHDQWSMEIIFSLLELFQDLAVFYLDVACKSVLSFSSFGF